MVMQPCFCPVGALAEGDGGRGHRRRPRREPRSCDHRPWGQRDGDHPLEPDAGHSEEACVHVAPSAQDLVISAHTWPDSSTTLASTCSFELSLCCHVYIKEVLAYVLQLHPGLCTLWVRVLTTINNQWVFIVFSSLSRLERQSVWNPMLHSTERKWDAHMWMHLSVSKVLIRCFCFNIWSEF